MSDIYDVIIMGAGPAGLAAGVYTGRARLNTLILEKGIPGGQILLTDWVENYPGFPDGVMPFELIEKIRKQAEKFGAKIETDEAKEILKTDKTWVILGKKKEYATRTIIIATGSVYRRLGLPNEAELTGRGVSYCAICDGAFFKDREVAVVGGGDDALTEALFLTKFCQKVMIIHRRDKFRAEKILQERAFANKKIEILWNCLVETIRGENKLESITIRNVKENKTFIKKIDGLFISVGMDPNSGFVKGLLELNEWGQIKVGPSMSTSQPGIFAAGDVTDACPRQMATAVGSGVNAALAVDEYLGSGLTI
jgi:thioredoxin reductase (NADPH)